MSKPFTIPEKVSAPPSGFMSLTIVGSGASTGVPVIGHIGTSCACADAIANPNGPNKRANVSLLVTTPRRAAEEGASHSEGAHDKPTTGEGEPHVDHATFSAPEGNQIDGLPVNCLLIDCGKTFREAYFRVLVQHRVRLVDALFLTHDHADAMAGLDDLRDLQEMHMIHGRDWVIDSYIPTYLHRETLTTLQERVGYVVRNSQEVGEAPASKAAHEACMTAHVAALKKEKGEDAWNVIGIRRSTALQFFTLPSDRIEPFYAPALCDAAAEHQDSMPLYSIPVEHGAGYTSLGFVFGRGTAFKGDPFDVSSRASGSCVVYISDISAIPAESMAFLRSLVKIDVLYLDCVHTSDMGPSPPHFTLDESIDFACQLKPRYVFLVGMYCQIEYHAGQRMLQEKLQERIAKGTLSEGEILGMEMGYDGMEIILPQ